jgi:hypothetical protein
MSQKPKSYKIEIFSLKYGFVSSRLADSLGESYKCTLVFIYVSFVTAGLVWGISYFSLLDQTKRFNRAKDLLYLICKTSINKKGQKSIILFFSL